MKYTLSQVSNIYHLVTKSKAIHSYMVQKQITNLNEI